MRRDTVLETERIEMILGGTVRGRPGKIDPRLETQTEQLESIPELTFKMRPIVLDLKTRSNPTYNRIEPKI